MGQQDQGKISKDSLTNDNENTTTQNRWDTAKTVLTEIHSNTGLPQDKEKSQIYTYT